MTQTRRPRAAQGTAAVGMQHRPFQTRDRPLPTVPRGQSVDNPRSQHRPFQTRGPVRRVAHPLPTVPRLLRGPAPWTKTRGQPDRTSPLSNAGQAPAAERQRKLTPVHTVSSKGCTTPDGQPAATRPRPPHRTSPDSNSGSVRRVAHPLPTVPRLLEDRPRGQSVDNPAEHRPFQTRAKRRPPSDSEN